VYFLVAEPSNTEQKKSEEERERMRERKKREAVKKEHAFLVSHKKYACLHILLIKECMYQKKITI
jgi:hypothetical protein